VHTCVVTVPPTRRRAFTGVCCRELDVSANFLTGEIPAALGDTNDNDFDGNPDSSLV
jgi:hypothetical protein